MTGIQDAHNLAWKLSEAVKRQSNEPLHLLQSYEAERKPVAIVRPSMYTKIPAQNTSNLTGRIANANTGLSYTRNLAKSSMSHDADRA